jgi:hypothetical protein
VHPFSPGQEIPTDLLERNRTYTSSFQKAENIPYYPVTRDRRYFSTFFTEDRIYLSSRSIAKNFHL